MAHRTTLRDIAHEVGVSVTTVSLVLNNRLARVSDETRAQILETAKRLRYVPNQNARSLLTKRTMLIALIVPDIENLFFAALARCLEESCQAAGYELVIANSNDRRAVERDLLQHVVARGVDGLFLIPARESYVDEVGLREDVRRVPCPVTLIDRLVSAQWCDGAGFDNVLGGALAARRLLEAGHTRIGCISGDGREGSANRRRRGFANVLEQAGVPLEPALDVAGDYRFDGGYAATAAMVDNGATAVFCCNDLMAMGLLRGLRERGLSVPADMSVIGYDNIMERFGMQIEVTTVEQDVAQLARAAWELLSARIGTPGEGHPWLAEPRTRVLAPCLVDKGSVRDLR